MLRLLREDQAVAPSSMVKSKVRIDPAAILAPMSDEWNGDTAYGAGVCRAGAMRLPENVDSSQRIFHLQAERAEQLKVFGVVRHERMPFGAIRKLI